jgi:predicted nucleotidyltransferase
LNNPGYIFEKENHLLNMRLSGSQIQCIKNTALAIFGQKTKVYLFGSRLDDTKKGGDIDLLIKPHQIFDEDYSFELKMKFLIQLKKLVGER